MRPSSLLVVIGLDVSSAFTVYARSWPLLPKPCCVTWVRTGNSDAAFADLVRRFGGDAATARPATWHDLETEAYEELDEDADGAMLAARAGAWTVVMEPFNPRGIDVRLLREVAAGSQAYSVMWTADRRVRVTYVADGELVATFDPVDLKSMTPEGGHAWLAGLTVTERQWRHNGFAAALATAEELTGIRVDDAWLRQVHLGIRLYPPPSRPATPMELLDPDMRTIAERDPRIGAIAADPTPDKLPEIVRIAAEIAVAAADLDEPLIEEALRFIAAGDRGAAAQEVRGRLFSLRDRYRSEGARRRDASPGHDPEHDRLLAKERAVQTLIYALKPGEDLAVLAAYTAETAEDARPSKENGDRERIRTLRVITHYLRTGESLL
mgnify:CR=1 FL=1